MYDGDTGNLLHVWRGGMAQAAGSDPAAHARTRHCGVLRKDNLFIPTEGC